MQLNLERYPLHQPRSDVWLRLVDRCKDDLDKDGMFSLTEFVAPSIAQAVATRLEPAFATRSFAHSREHNIYFRDDISEISESHPALMRFHTSNSTLCGDQVKDSLMAQLYHWPEFATFLAAVLDKPMLFPMDDELAGLNVMSYRDGQTLGWHFDRSEFTTTLLLQDADSGGEFFYRPNLRSDENPNYEGVARLVNGEDPETHRMRLRPGTLNIFKGKNTPHMVSEVGKGQPRMVAVFSFYESPDVRFSDQERLEFYGRMK